MRRSRARREQPSAPVDPTMAWMRAEIDRWRAELNPVSTEEADRG